MIGVVEVPPSTSGIDAFESGLLLPVPATQKNAIVMEERDGTNVQRLTASAVVCKVGGRTVIKDRKIKIDLFLTDARFALACSKYDKGGGWVGSAGVMIAANAVSKARAAIRSRGQMLVGQVRYPWIYKVGSSPKTGWASEEKLFFHETTKAGATTLTLTLPKDVDAALVAAEVTRRLARYRLAHEELDADTRQQIERLTDVEPADATAVGDRERYFTIPAPRFVDEASARISPNATKGGAE
jgi:hypothetical protein